MMERNLLILNAFFYLEEAREIREEKDIIVPTISYTE